MIALWQTALFDGLIDPDGNLLETNKESAAGRRRRTAETVGNGEALGGPRLDPVVALCALRRAFPDGEGRPARLLRP